MNMVQVVKICFLGKAEALSSPEAGSSLFLVNSVAICLGPPVAGNPLCPVLESLAFAFSPSLDCKPFQGNNLHFFFFGCSLKKDRFL